MRKIKTFEGATGNGGFTLIEMLIVIAVIAILAGVVLTGVSGFQASARDTRRIGDLRNLQNYLELFFNKCGNYPVSGDGTCGTVGSEGSLTATELQTALLSVTSQVPKDPGTNGYEYGYSADGLSYVLKATLEKENKALQDDIDGSPYGNVDCGTQGSSEREFCIQS